MASNSSVIELTSVDADNGSAANSDQYVSCHMIPCTIHHDGKSQVEKYFLPAIKTNETDGHLTASFRGRPLAGLEMNLPEDYIGLNLVSEDEPGGKTENSKPTTSTWKVKQTFDRFTYWNFDKIPSANDKIQQAMTWLDVAKAINSDPTATTVPDERGDKL